MVLLARRADHACTSDAGELDRDRANPSRRGMNEDRIRVPDVGPPERLVRGQADQRKCSRLRPGQCGWFAGNRTNGRRDELGISAILQWSRRT
jgi:hypothetical protein